MYKQFARRFAKELKQFLTQQILVGLLVAVVILANQYRSGQITRNSLSTNLWQIVLPYLVVALLAAAYHFFRTIYFLLSEAHPPERSSLIWTDSVSPSKGSASRRTRWIVTGCLALLFGFVGLFISSDFRPKKKPLPPAPPIALEVIAEDEVDWRGELEKRDLESPNAMAPYSPCVGKEGKIYRLGHAESFPVGPNSRRPFIIFKPLGVRVINSSKDENNTYVIFDVSVVNQGEASIVKDWFLCMLDKGKPTFFPALRYSDSTKGLFNNQMSLADLTISNSIEHGHAVEGPLFFSIPKKLTMSQSTSFGSLHCRDYMDHKTSITFGLSPAQRKPKNRAPIGTASKGLSAVAK